MRLVIIPDGTVRTLYDETLPLAELGSLAIERASHVEPDAHGQWWARVIDGPELGPFALRSAALAAEVAWLEQHRLTPLSQETPWPD